MNLLKKSITLVLIFVFPSTLFAADFYLQMADCKIAAAPLLISAPIKVGHGEMSTTSCNRNPKKIVCNTSFNEGGVSNRKGPLEYHVEMDSGPLLIFTDNKFADYYVINRTSHSVAVISRMVVPSSNVVGVKICNGVYLTDSEFELMKKK